MTTSQESGGASRVLPVNQFEIRDAEEIDRLHVALDSARHKSEDYELRAKAAEATLERVRADAKIGLSLIGYPGRNQAKDTIDIIDGKTK